MKTLFYIESPAIWGEAFFDEEGNLVHYNHENDNNFRMEYMKWIGEYFGGQIVTLDTEFKELDDTEDYEEIIAANKSRILRAIKKAKKKE